MSYDYRYSQTTRNRPGRRTYYPPPPTRGNQANHSLLGYWVPLLVTGTIAIGGLAAWIWSERREHDEDDYPHDKPPRPQTGMGGPYPTQGSQPYPGPPGPGQGPQSGPGGPVPPYPQGPMPSQSGGPQGGPPPPPPAGGEAASYYTATERNQSRETDQQEDSTWYGWATGAMKRTPSPQQLFDRAGKGVTAGMAAAGAALGSIMEDDNERYDDRREQRSSEKRSERRETREDREREGFSDHERWSEEADERQQRISIVDEQSERRAEVARGVREDKGKGRAKRAVAVVVNADTSADIDHDDDAEYRTEHASILSHLPTEHNSDTTDLFVLIYAPELKELPPLNYKQPTDVPSAVGSSYGQIDTPAVTPGSELQSMSPRIDAVDSGSKQFDALYTQALSLVTSPAQILPFTTPEGYVHILRHLAPQLVYISDTLSGDEGEGIAQLKGWVGHTILVAGDEGHGGLADTETEDEGGRDKQERKHRWYDHSQLVGLGKDVEVVDAVRVGDDWAKRVGGRD